MLRAGRRVRISGHDREPPAPRPLLTSAQWISRNRSRGDLALHSLRLLDFVVYGTEPGPGSVALDVDVVAEASRNQE